MTKSKTKNGQTPLEKVKQHWKPISIAVIISILGCAAIIANRSRTPSIEEVIRLAYSSLTVREINDMLPTHIGCVAYNGNAVEIEFPAGTLVFGLGPGWSNEPDVCAHVSGIEYPAESTGVDAFTRRLIYIQEYIGMYVMDFLYRENPGIDTNKIPEEELDTLGDGLKVFLLPPELQAQLGFGFNDVTTGQPTHVQWDGISQPSCQVLHAINLLSWNERIRPGGIEQTLKAFNCD